MHQDIVVVELIRPRPARHKWVACVLPRIVFQARRYVPQRAEMDGSAGDIDVGGTDAALTLALLEMQLALQQFLEGRRGTRFDLEAQDGLERAARELFFNRLEEVAS